MAESFGTLKALPDWNHWVRRYWLDRWLHLVGFDTMSAGTDPQIDPQFTRKQICVWMLAGASTLLLFPACASCQRNAIMPDVDLIVTSAAAYDPLAGLHGGERFPKGARLLLLHEGKAETLVSGFAASADANVSFDGSRILFAGKQTASDPWQIWEMTLADRLVRRVIATATDAERPLYLPGGRMVWAQRAAQGFEIESAEDGEESGRRFLNPTAGPGIVRLTYVRASVFPDTVLQDGRILFEAGFPLGSGSTPELFLVYADGSGVESYRCDHGHARWGGAQMASGDVVFTHGASLARFTSPLAHEESIAAPSGEYAGGLAETASGSWLLCERGSASNFYAIKQWSPGAAMKTLWARGGENLVEPVLVAPRTPPNRHPSGLHPWNYANLLALDSRLSRAGDLKLAPSAVQVEMVDDGGHAVVVGTAPVEADGSFYVQTPADRQVRFALLDQHGVVLRREHGWFWARAGEQRICVGCHTGPERAPENHVPAVLLHSTTPADLTGTTIADRRHNELPGAGRASSSLRDAGQGVK